MRKRILTMFLLLCLLHMCGLAEVNSEYLAELQLLNEYMRTAGENAPVGIEKICDQIEGNGRIGEYTVEFGIYANVLRLLEAEDYAAALSDAGDLLNGSSFEKFRAYLADGEELRSWGLYALDSVERLYSYVQGRAAEASDDWKKAVQYYSACEQFMDARERKQFADLVTPTSSPMPSCTLDELSTTASLKELPLTYPYIQGIPAVATDDLAFRTGPNTEYVWLYMYDKTNPIVAFEYENGNGVTWVLVEYEYNEKKWRAYTGLKRISVNGDLPWANHLNKTVTVSENTALYAAPSSLGGERGISLSVYQQVTLLEYDGEYAYVELTDKRSNEKTRGYIPVWTISEQELNDEAKP